METIESLLLDPRITRFEKVCNGNLMVLGKIMEENETLDEYCIKKMNTSNIWVNLERNSNFLFQAFNIKKKKIQRESGIR